MIFLLSIGYGLIAVVLGTTFGYVIYGFGYVFIAVYFASRNYNYVLRILTQILFPYIVMIVSLIIGNFLFSNDFTLKQQILCATWKLLIVISFTTLSLWLVYRKTRIFSMMRAELFNWIVKCKWNFLYRN